MNRVSSRRIFVLVAVSAVLTSQAAWAETDLVYDRGRMGAVLNTVSKQIEKHYYDPNLNGVDWKALTAEAKQRLEKAQNMGQMVLVVFALADKLDDSHTAFIPPQRKGKVRFGFDAKPVGDKILVHQVWKKRRAEAAGLKEGDQILKVNGFDVQRDAWAKMSLFLRAIQPVSSMELTIKRGAEAPQKIVIESQVDEGAGGAARDLSTLASVYQLAREADLEEKEYSEQFGAPFEARVLEGGIGYLRVEGLPVNPSRLEGLVDSIKDAKAAVLDLRGNFGGSPKALNAIADHFDKDAVPIAEIIDRKKTEAYQAAPRAPQLSGPLFVLVDADTTGMAEVLARHFQASGRAKIIGDKTSGRTTAARIFNEQAGVQNILIYGISISVGKVLLPGKEILEKRGIIPDVSCLPTPEQLSGRVDACKEVAVSAAKEALSGAEKK
jgi:carboxyl-terminal processing protease